MRRILGLMCFLFLLTTQVQAIECNRSNYKKFIFDSVMTDELITNTGAGCSLSRIDLRWKNLVRADFRLANLRRSDLRYSRCVGANFRGADLSNADLRGTNLSRANLVETILYRAKYDDTTDFPGDDKDFIEDHPEMIKTYNRNKR